MTGKGHPFKFVINLCSCLSSGAELHNKMTIIWVSRGASSCGFQQKDLRASCSWSLMRRSDTWRNSSKSHMGRKVLYFQHNVLPAHGSCRGQTPLWQVLVNQISLTLHNTWYLEIFLFLKISRKLIRHQPVPNQALCCSECRCKDDAAAYSPGGKGPGVGVIAWEEQEWPLGDLPSLIPWRNITVEPTLSITGLGEQVRMRRLVLPIISLPNMRGRGHSLLKSAPHPIKNWHYFSCITCNLLIKPIFKLR